MTKTPSALVGYVDPATGNLWAFEDRGGTPVPVIVDGEINPAYRNILNASLLMFRTLEELRPSFERLIECLEAYNVEQFVGPVDKLLAAVAVAERCAKEGVLNVIATQKGVDKPK